MKKPRLIPGLRTDIDGVFDQFKVYGTNLANNATNVLPATGFGTDTDALRLPTPQSSLGGRLSPGIVPEADQMQNFKIPVLSGGVPTGETQDSLANTYYFPQGISAGTYQLVYVARYTNGGTFGTAGLVPVNCILDQAPGFNNNTSSTFNNGTAATVTQIISIANVEVTSANAYLTYAFVGAATVPISADLYVTRLPLG